MRTRSMWRLGKTKCQPPSFPQLLTRLPRHGNFSSKMTPVERGFESVTLSDTASQVLRLPLGCCVDQLFSVSSAELRSVTSGPFRTPFSS